MSTYLANSSAPSAAVVAPSVSPEKRDVARLASGAGVALGGRIAGRGIRLLLDIALARLLGPAQFGLYAIGWTITRMVTLFTPLGLDAGVIRFGAKYWREDKSTFRQVLSKSLLFASLSGLIFGGVFYGAARWIGEGIFHSAQMTEVVKGFALAFPLATILKVAAATTRISQRMKFSVIAEDISQPAWDLLLVLAFALLWTRSLAAAIVACIVSHGLAAALARWYAQRLFPNVGSPVAASRFDGKQLLAFSLPASLTGVFGVMIIWVDRLLVGYYRPNADVGIYQAASQVSIAFAIILGAMNAIFSPMTADLFHRGELRRLEEIFRISTKWGLYLSLPLFLVTFFASHEVMIALFGAPYVAGWSVLVILALGQVFNAGTGPVGMLLVMAGYQNRMFLVSGTMFVLSVVMGIVLIPRYGMVGAATATALAVSGLFIAAIVLAQVVLGMRPYDRRYLKGLAATLVTTVALLLVRKMEVFPAPLQALVTLVVAVAVFAGTLWFAGLDAEDREFMQLLLARFNAR
ncbi:MAG TPA: flippase [Terriglobales bacterium]|jgi:O-antigen/teichoic acid export membrane protein|nr:flippase [Terriglobales bacterium]